MRPFHWFGPETVAQLREQLNLAGDGAILKVYQEGQAMELEVVPAASGTGDARITFQPLNDSRVCPPICPD